MPYTNVIAGEEKSMPDFKGLKHRLILFSGANVAGDFKLKPMLFTILKILGPLRIMLNPLCLCCISGTTKPEWQHICLQHGLLNILNSLLRPTAQEKKKIIFKYYCSLTMHMLPKRLMFSHQTTQYPFCRSMDLQLSSLINNFIQL